MVAVSGVAMNLDGRGGGREGGGEGKTAHDPTGFDRNVGPECGG